MKARLNQLKQRLLALSIFQAGSLLDTLVDAWRNRSTLNDDKKTREELAFLPAALEVQHTPPHPLSRWLGWSLTTLFAIALLWAFFGHVNIVAVAEGKIIPSGKSKTIQPLEKGVVATIHVEDGQFVEQGEALIELDRTLTQADQQRIANELHTARLTLSRQQALLARLQQQAASDTATFPLIDYPANTTAADQLLQQQLLGSEWQAYLSRQASLNSQLATHQGERAANQAIIEKLEGTLPLITKRTQAFKDMLDKKLGSETQYLELEEQRITQQQDLVAAKARDRQIQAAIASTGSELNTLKADTEAQNLNAISESERRIRSLAEELGKATDLNSKQILYAPVAGQIQQLAIHTVGGVVTEAQALMVIVPREEYLEVEAWLPNKDIGFVHEGAEAEIKVNTFPYTRYGVLDATVTHVSADAVTDEDKGLVYTLRLRLKQDSMNIDGKTIRLMPGMAVSAEVKTGERRLMEYFLSPLMQAAGESVRER
ncbi:MAG TPA: HlyD family type I secretion periplasmic adaptor subunit [Pseudomonadales bacterium]